ncbi:MAG: GntR family transcriptional regulator [Tannerellaceae bacterium]|nr:GntR family transcriptional regulator [Tannerellaceae bacterium]
MNLQIDHSSDKPLHYQAEEVLRKLIEQPEYKEGKLLPNEIALSEQLKISRNTLRQAINKLVFEGLLIRKKGYGTKVAPQRVLSGATNWMSFSQEMKMLGIEVWNFELHLSWQLPTDEIAAFFGIEKTRRVLTLNRLRGTKEAPFVYFTSAFNPAIPLTGNEDFNQPLYDLLEKKYEIIVKTSKEEISARCADEIIASKLEITPEDPILLRKRFVYDTTNLPVEYNVGYYRADSFTYTIECTR